MAKLSEREIPIGTDPKRLLAICVGGPWDGDEINVPRHLRYVHVSLPKTGGAYLYSIEQWSSGNRLVGIARGEDVPSAEVLPRVLDAYSALHRQARSLQARSSLAVDGCGCPSCTRAREREASIDWLQVARDSARADAAERTLGNVWGGDSAPVAQVESPEPAGSFSALEKYARESLAKSSMPVADLLDLPIEMPQAGGCPECGGCGFYQGLVERSPCSRGCPPASSSPG